MRKLFAVAIAVFMLGLASAPEAKAGPVALSMTSVGSTTEFTLSGTYDSNVPVFSFNGVQVSAPNDGYAFSFTLNTAADNNADFAPSPSDGLFDVSAMFSFSLNGGPSVSLGTFMVEFANDKGGNPGGLAFCFDDDSCTSNTDWIIGGQALFSGNVNHPTFISTVNAQINLDPKVSGFEINGSTPPFTFSSTPAPFNPTPTPEPRSIFLLGTGLLGLGFAVRRKLRLT